MKRIKRNETFQNLYKLKIEVIDKSGQSHGINFVTKL